MSIRVFREFLTTRPDGTVDASRVISRDCYEAFLAAKKSEDCAGEAKKFRRTLTTHLTGVDGRRAFDKPEEDAILQLLRQNKPWPCFPAEQQVGSMFRGKGFHEKQVLMSVLTSPQQQAAAAAASASSSSNSTKRAKLQQHQQDTPSPPLPPPAAAAAAASPAAGLALRSLAACSSSSTPAADAPPSMLLLPQQHPQVSSQLVTAEQVAKHILNQANNTFVFSLASEVVRFSQSFASFGIDVWRSVFGIFRFVILVRTQAVYRDVPDEYARELCERVSREDDDKLSVMIVDVLQKDLERRCRYQNATSVLQFGLLAPHVLGHEGRAVEPPAPRLHSMRVESSDLFDMSMAIGSSYAQPGQTFYIRHQTMMLGGDKMHFKASYRVDPASLLLVCKTVPAQPLEEPPQQQPHQAAAAAAATAAGDSSDEARAAGHILVASRFSSFANTVVAAAAAGGGSGSTGSNSPAVVATPTFPLHHLQPPPPQ